MTQHGSKKPSCGKMRARRANGGPRGNGQSPAILEQQKAVLSKAASLLSGPDLMSGFTGCVTSSGRLGGKDSWAQWLQ